MPETFRDPETGEEFEAAEPPKRLRRPYEARPQGWERRIEAFRRAAPNWQWVVLLEQGTADSASSTISKMQRLGLAEGLELAQDDKRILARITRTGAAEGTEASP